MFTGTVTRFDHSRGFGFIRPDDGQSLPPQIVREVFVHAGQIERDGIALLSPGDRVSFRLKPGRNHPDKFEARDIRLADNAAPVRYGV